MITMNKTSLKWAKVTSSYGNNKNDKKIHILLYIILFLNETMTDEKQKARQMDTLVSISRLLHSEPPL